MPSRDKRRRTAKPTSAGATSVGSNWKQMQQKLKASSASSVSSSRPAKRFKRWKKPRTDRGAGAAAAAAAAEAEEAAAPAFPKHDLMQPLQLLPFQRGEDAEAALPTVIALDCEMVGVGPRGETSALARTCVIDECGAVIYDKYCRPKEKVVDFRTKWSGIVPRDLKGAMSTMQMVKEVAAIMKGKLLVGHALQNDLSALFLDHPKAMIRDTALYKPLQREVGAVVRRGRAHGGGGAGKRRPRALRHLCQEHLGYAIQDHGDAGHSPDEDARAALQLYRKFRVQWENALYSKRNPRGGGGKKKRRGTGSGSSSSNHTERAGAGAGRRRRGKPRPSDRPEY